MIIRLTFLFFCATIFFSCQKDVNIDLPHPEEKIVVEGWIEQNQHPVVILTRNSAYFSSIDTTSLVNMFVKNAQVYVHDGINSELLQLDNSNLFSKQWPYYFYKGSQIQGEVGKTYFLEIIIGNDTITSETTIPHLIELDTIWWEPDNLNNPNNDTLGYIWAIYTDNLNTKEYFRLFTKRRGRDFDFVPLFGSIYDDIYFEGQTLPFSLYRGIESISDVETLMEDKEIFYFKKGDTVDVKVSNIDREHYEFWRTIEQEIYMGGNPFTFPVQVRHNINGAIGIWGGYASTYYKLVIGE